MWAAVAFLFLIVVLGFMHMAQTSLTHERDERKRLGKELDEAKDRLSRALLDHPGDFDLHAALADRVKRLQERYEA